MVETSRYRTKTFIEKRDGKAPEGKWPIALDIGYSAVKIISPNCAAMFPSYAFQDNDLKLIGTLSDECIRYKNLDTNETWLVGRMAQNTISDTDTSITEEALYGRERYFDPMFRVISETGLGIAMMANDIASPQGREVSVQTGLPPAYLRMDKDALADVLEGRHHFSLRFGSGNELVFDFDINRNNIYIMEQPMGTLFSVVVDNDGKFVPDANDFFQKNVMVFDPGFGTLDLFPIKCHKLQKSQTFADLGMRQVLKSTADALREEYGIDISVPAMQKHLETGTVLLYDRKKRSSSEIQFDEILEKCSKKVCIDALDRMCQVCPIQEFNYIIITGGTGLAWEEEIKEYFADMRSLKVVSGGRNDTLSSVFANVRGYYLYRKMKLK